jgi:hypothetical protein
MKKNLLSLIAFICGITMTSIAQIPNPGFEYWTAGDPDGWATSNVFPIGLINITQTTDNHSGSYALRGEVVNFAGTPMGPVIQSGPGGRGFPISERYNSFELYYKFTSVGGDKFSVNVALEKDGNPIAQGAVALPATVSNYTHLTVPLEYTTNDVPDSAIIQILITGPVTGADYHIGSVMFVDDLLFSLATGVEDISISNLAGKCYPNPSVDIINIPLNENVSGEVILNVFDTYGKEVKTIAGQPQQFGKNVFQFSVEDLSTGLYFYSINGQKRYYQGKFNVTR